MHFLISFNAVSPQLAFFPLSATHLFSHTHGHSNFLLPHTSMSLRKTAEHQRLIPTLFVSLHYVFLWKSHGHLAIVPFNSEIHRPIQQLKRNKMQMHDHCLVTQLEFEHPLRSLSYTASTHCTFYDIFALCLLYLWMLVPPPVSLLLPRFSLFELLFFQGAYFGSAGCLLELSTFLARSAILVR